MRLREFTLFLLLTFTMMAGRAAGEVNIMDYAVGMDLQETKVPACLQGKEYLSLCNLHEDAAGNLCRGMVDAGAVTGLEGNLSCVAVSSEKEPLA